MAKVIPKEEKRALASHIELVFILKGQNIYSTMLLAVKKLEMSLLKYVVCLTSSKTLSQTEQG